MLTFFRNDLVPILTFCALWQFLVLQSVKMFSFQFRMKRNSKFPHALAEARLKTTYFDNDFSFKLFR